MLAQSSMAKAPALSPCLHQVGGHSTQDGLATAYVDGQGRFYKLLQAGPRAQREVEFYQSVQEAERASGSSGSSELACSSGRNKDLLALAPFVPTFHGVLPAAGGDLLVLEDLCSGYRAPCVMDVKIGFRTWYEWGEEGYIDKCRAKDEATTQGAVGFRICGMHVLSSSQAEAPSSGTKRDRHWGKGLKQEQLPAVFRAFCTNGSTRAQHVLGGPHGVLAQLSDLQACFQRQSACHFYAASLLLMYEGAPGSSEPPAAELDAAALRVRVRLVDFAHVFPPPEPGLTDINFLSGLNSLIRTLEGVLAAES